MATTPVSEPWLVEDCYRENARRMSAFDPDLMQPLLFPAVAGLAVRGSGFGNLEELINSGCSSSSKSGRTDTRKPAARNQSIF